MSHYVIGDVHGQLDALTALLSRIRYNSSVDTLYFVGDYVDWGPKSIETLEYVMQLSKSGNAHCVLGNHDFMMRETIKSEQKSFSTLIGASVWACNNGAQTLKEYLKLPETKQKEIADWLNTLPLAIDGIKVGDKTYCVAHATRKIRGRKTGVLAEETQVWHRLNPNEDPFNGDKNFDGQTLICGHTITKYIVHHGTFLPYFDKRYINIDTGAKMMGFDDMARMTALRLEDLKFTSFPPDNK